MSGDAPHFPPPGQKDAYRTPEPAPAPAPKVVTRPEPPPDSHAHAKLTREEMRALITVEAAKHPPWRKSLRRSAVFLPVTLVAHFLGTSWWSLALGALLYVGALVWIARPLLRRDDFA